MGIRIKVKDERGVVIHTAGIYVPADESFDEARFPLLSGIDAYGDTIFNRGQSRRLVGEIAALESAALPKEQAASLEEVVDVCERFVTSPPHRYLWFIGD